MTSARMLAKYLSKPVFRYKHKLHSPTAIVICLVRFFHFFGLPLVGFFAHTGLVSAAAPEYISYSYREEPLEEVLEDLGRRYDLIFVYSQNNQLTSQTISARSGLVDVDQGLQLLFAETAIEFRRRDTRVLLRYSQSKAQELLSSTTPSLPRDQTSAPDRLASSNREIPIQTNGAAPATNTSDETLVGINVDSITLVDTVQSPTIYSDEEFESLPPPPPLIQGSRTTAINRQRDLPNVETDTSRRSLSLKRRLGQFSLLPGLSTNGTRPRRFINSVSVNLPAGLNGGLNGAEFGLLFNGVEQEARGLQLSGAINYARRKLTGTQIAGLANLTALGQGVQIAGIVNASTRSLDGTQISSLLNFTRNEAGRQYSLGLNISGSGVKRQIGLVNFSSEVSGGQIGLINVADTVAGRSFGLLNFVKRGYNVAEIARDMTQAWSGNLKFGSYQFYNILELSVGLRNINKIGQDDRSRQPVWSLGYGFGWKNQVDPDLGALRSSTEFVVSHANRGAQWTSRLNLYLHFRQTWDWAIDAKVSVFIGPTLVLHWTQLTNEELDGMQPWNTHIIRTRYDRIRFAAMIGLRFGVRIGRL